MAKKRKTKTTTANGITGVHPEPQAIEYVFEWREEGQGWRGWFHDGNPGARRGTMIIEPKGGLHGGWVWRFKWSRDAPDAWPPGSRDGWITGEHADPNQATEDCEICLRALLLDADRKYKEWWDKLPEAK